MAKIEYAVNMDREKNLVNVESVIADASIGRFSVKDGVVPLGDKPAAPLSLEISANNFNLEKARPFAAIFASIPKDMQLAGIADSTILVRSEKKIYKFNTDSTEIKDLRLTFPDSNSFEPGNVTVAFDAEADADKSIRIKTFQLDSEIVKLKFTESQLSQSSEDDKTTLRVQAECEYDWATLSPVTARFLPEDLMLQGKRKDMINLTSEYPAGQTDKLLSNLNAKAKLGFEQAGYMGLDFGPTDVNVEVHNGLLKIAPFTTTINEGQFNFTGGADFKQKPTLFKAVKPIQMVKDMKVNDETTKSLLKYVNPIFADAVNVNGIAHFNCEQLAIPLSTGAKNDAVVIGTISMDNVRMQTSDLLIQILKLFGGGDRSTVMTIHPTRFVLSNGVLRYEDMQVDVGDNPVNFKGVIGLDKSLDMTVTLPYTTEGRTARIGREILGKRIVLPLKGTVDEPQLDTAKLLEDQAIQKGLELLEELFK